MNLYAYRGTAELGQESLGTADKILSRGHYRTLTGFLRYGIPDTWKGTPYRVYSFTNFYDNQSFKLVYRGD